LDGGGDVLKIRKCDAIGDEALGPMGYCRGDQSVSHGFEGVKNFHPMPDVSPSGSNACGGNTAGSGRGLSMGRIFVFQVHMSKSRPPKRPPKYALAEPWDGPRRSNVNQCSREEVMRS